MSSERVSGSVNSNCFTELVPLSAIPYYAKPTATATQLPSTLERLSGGSFAIQIQLEHKRKFAAFRASIAASEGTEEAELKKRKKASSLFTIVRKAIPHDKPWEGIAPLRRPESITEWYSKTATPAEWVKLTDKKRQILSHIGYIHETDAGQRHPDRTCAWSANGRYHFEPRGKDSKTPQCWSYKESAAGIYTTAFSNKFLACTRCRFVDRECYLTYLANHKQREEAEKLLKAT